MATESVTVVRLYLREGEHLLAETIKLLHDEERIAGLTVLRGLAGFGPDGKVHTASLLDLSLDLPLIVEFYGLPDPVANVIERLESRLGLSHIVSWPARVHKSEL